MRIYKPALIIIIISFFFCNPLNAQNQASKWYFGNQAGLDFMSNPPAVVQGSMLTYAACSSIADAAGNLLFYTNGVTVWNQNHQVMQTGLQGNVNAGQNSIVVKQPGNTNIYYIFTTNWNLGMSYSTVDMNLAAGLGSVTVLNTTLIASNNQQNNGVYIDKISATKHCNGTDIWVVSRDNQWNNVNGANGIQNFYSFLVTAAGVNTVPVVSAAQTWTNNGGYNYGCMKISPNGTKIGMASSNNWWWNGQGQNQTNYTFELWDFNSGTGAVTNSLALGSYTWNGVNGWSWGYGCEFSPDGTKFYGTNPYFNNVNNINNAGILQWDMCAGSPTAIAASEFTVTVNNPVNNLNNYFYSMQVAPNGKIYVARYYQTALDVINNPNATGAACGYMALAQSIGTRTCYQGLPNFMTSYMSSTPPLPPFTYTVNTTVSCLTTSFTAPNNPTFACSAMGYNVNGIGWNFGDPGSGAANTSTLQTPVHVYPVPGTYTATLTYFNSCGSNTVALPVVINGASLTVTTASITCANLGSATVTAQGGIGPFSYTWMPTAQTSSVANGLQPGNYSISVVDNGGNCAYTSTVNFASLIPLTGVVNNSPNIPCNGVWTGTGSVTLAGGSGSYYYNWYNGITSQTVASPTNLSAGVQTLTVIDALTSCTMTQNYFINQPPPMNLGIVASSPTTCAGTGITFTATNSGGTPGAGYTYTWTNGLASNIRTVTQAAAGVYTYYVNSRDGNNCNITQSISVTFVVNPTITVSNVSICPLQTGTLMPSGAASYTWMPSGLVNPTFTDNPMVTTGYVINGSALGCTATAVTGSIILKPLPSPTITSNSPVCNGQSLIMSSNTGASYQWNGPLGFTSSLRSPTINPASPGNTGIYSLTLTAANTCTASTTATLTVHPTPTIALSSNTVCVTQTLNLNANSFAGATFSWTGPASFTSTLQNPTRINAATNMTGVYTLQVTSLQGCTNTAQTSGSVVAMPVPLITANASSMCLGSNLNLAGSGGVLYSWSGPNGFGTAAQNPNISNITLAANGIYTLLVTTGPCTITTTKQITVFPLPAPSASSVPTCDTKNLHLLSNGGGGIIFYWTGPFNYTSAVQNPTITQATPLRTGLYNLLVTDVNGCQASTSTQVNIMMNPVVEATGATVCFGHPAVLTASGAVSYLWTGPNNYISYNRNATVPAATSVQQQVYQVMGTAPNSCTNIATVVLKTIPLPVPQATITQQACLNSTIHLQASGGDTYQWLGPYNYYSTKQNGTFVANNIAYTGIYTLTAFSNAGCNARTTVALQLDPAPEGDLINTTGNSCVPFCSEFSLQSRNNIPVTNTIWQINGQTYDTPAFNYCITYPGDYLVIGSFTNALGCVNTSSFNISGYALPKANFEFFPETPIENFDPVKFTSTSTGQNLSNWSWYFIDNSIPKAIGENTTYTFEKSGTYPVALVVKNNVGCSDTITKTITVEADFNLYVPAAFTPNMDELNDLFHAKGTGVVKYEMVVFDRWGEKLFQTTDLLKGWDGSFKGQECKSDVYVWKLKATDAKGRTKEMNGFVTLYR